MTHPVSPAPQRGPVWHYLHLYMIYVWIPVGLVAYSGWLHGPAGDVAVGLVPLLLAVELAAVSRHTAATCPVCRSIEARQTPVGRLGVVASLRLVHVMRRHVRWLVMVMTVLPVIVGLTTDRLWLGFVVLAASSLLVDGLARRHRYLQAWCPDCAFEARDGVSLPHPDDGHP